MTTITRPSGLTVAARNIRWQFRHEEHGPVLIDLVSLTPAQLRELRRAGEQLAGPTGINTFVKATHCLEGVQFSVSQEVSRDMERSTLSCLPEDIELPAASLEFIWQDPTLPSILVTKVQASDGGGLAFVADSKESLDTAWVFSSARSRLHQLLDPRYVVERMEGYLDMDGNLEPSETEAMRYLALLCLKVIAFSQIPQFRPVSIHTHAERKAAGLLEGGKHRPRRPALLIRYLPRVAREVSADSVHPLGTTRRFQGRAGHIRHFSSAYFTHARGTWKYIPPVTPPGGVKIVYRVRKLKHEPAA